MTILEFLDKYLFAKTVSLVKKTTIVICIIILLWLINSIFGFSYIYENRRLEAIEKTVDLLHNPKVDSVTKARLELDFEKFSADKSYLNYWLHSNFFKTSSTSQTNATTKDKHVVIGNAKPNADKQITPINVFDHIISFILTSSLIFLSLAINIFEDFTDNLKARYFLLGCLGLVFVLSLIAYIVNLIFPTYTLAQLSRQNVVVQIVLIGLLYLFLYIRHVSKKSLIRQDQQQPKHE